MKGHFDKSFKYLKVFWFFFHFQFKEGNLSYLIVSLGDSQKFQEPEIKLDSLPETLKYKTFFGKAVQVISTKAKTS